MIKELPIMKLFHIIKRHIKQSGSDLQKCYKRDQVMMAGDHIIGLGDKGRINVFLEFHHSMKTKQSCLF